MTTMSRSAGAALSHGREQLDHDVAPPRPLRRVDGQVGCRGAERIERYKVTSSHMVPTMFNRMLQLPDEVRTKYDVSSTRYMVHAAAPCPVETRRR